MSLSPEPPLYAWILSLNRIPSYEEYQLCFRCLDDPSRAKVAELVRDGRKDEAWACLCGRLLPHIVMNQRQIPPRAWYIHGNEDGAKPAIVSLGYDKKLGYNVARHGQVVAMAFALGPGPAVANVGCDVRRVATPPRVPVSIFVESLSHKITDLERSFLFGQPDDVILRRLFILWTMKEAYLKAIGQPLHLGIAWDRIECDIPNETILVDGSQLRGWEFRMFVANVTTTPKDEMYQVTCAIHRGGDKTKFFWNHGQKSAVLDSWLRFLTVDSIMDAVWQLPYEHIINARG